MNHLDIQFATQIEDGPTRADIHQWVLATLKKKNTTGSLVVRIVDIPEMSDLNQTYRQKSGPTNVLSFPSQLPFRQFSHILGDIIICAPVVATEAKTQQKPVIAHWAHIVVHGILHLLGHDHQQSQQAKEMESLEIELLAAFGYPNPY